MSKNMIFLILGVLTAWVVISFFTKDYNYEYLFTLFTGVALGYGVGKKDAETEE